MVDIYRHIKSKLITPFWGTFILFVFFTNLSSAQSAKQYLEKGTSYLEQQDYYAAATVFGQAVEKFPDNIDFRYNQATSLRLYNNYEDAATAYKNLITDDTQKKYADAPFYYALMLKQQGKYDLAIKQLERFKKGYKKKNISSSKIDQEITSCRWALDHSTPLSLEIIHLSDSINSPFSDFNPITTLDGGLLFTSLRPLSKSATTSKSKFYGIDSTDTSLLKLLSKLENKHVANGHFNSDFSLFYFNVCDVEAGKRCDIYVAKAENNSWSDALEVKGINHKSYTSTQPCIVLESGQNYLYFSSDRLGTKGGMDIWKAKQTAFDKFEYPENVTSLNTDGNEYSVSFLADSNILFFSSDGWNGYGGLDIFSYKISSPDSLPQNLGLPINSPANDFGYHISADRTQAYFASNRKGSRYIKSQTCCYDIWRYETGVKKEPIIAKIEETKKDTSVVLANIENLITETDPTQSSISTPNSMSEPEVVKEINIAPPFKDNVVAMKKLLPLVLYFHNDEPEPRSLSDTTELNYATTFEGYTRMQQEYVTNFAKGNNSNAKIEINNLFDNHVNKGFYDLVSFSAYLFDALNAGEKITVTLSGYCSPLNYNQYNIHLGNRRTASLINYFNQYRAGELSTYLANGKLILKTISLGEEKAPTGISDNRLDTQNSVYNPIAALERRVEIISVARD